MGATLPVLSSFYARDIGRIGLRVGSLYALNTFGSVLGAAATGFVLIPALGMNAATTTAATMNILLGAVALTVSRAAERTPHEAIPAHEPVPKKTLRSSESEAERGQITVVIAG